MNQEICSNVYIISMVLSPTAVSSILCIADSIVASLKRHITQVCCSFIRKYQITFNLAQEWTPIEKQHTSLWLQNSLKWFRRLWHLVAEGCTTCHFMFLAVSQKL